MDPHAGVPPAIEMRGISKNFPGVRALQNVDLSIEQGEIHALVGKNGAGKSTLMHILTGIYHPDAGEIVVRGRQIGSMTTAQSRDAGIRLVSQHAKYVPGLSIAENISAGDLPRSRLGFVDWGQLNRKAQERLEQFGLQIDVQRKMEGLSVAERQMIEIARALFADASVIILDEPTAPLPKHEVDLLFRFVRLQRERGASFIYISHYLEEVFAIADRVTVLRNGERVGVYSVSEITQGTLIRLISGADVQRFSPPRRETTGERVLETRNLTRGGVYQGLTLAVERGEVVGLTGLEGSGKSTFARALYGLLPLGDGEVRLAGKPYAVDGPGEALRRGVAYLPRDRHRLGIVQGRSVRENLVLSVLERVTGLLGFLNRGRERSLVQSYIDRLAIKTPSMQQAIENLSGGNQQKVVVAKLAATQPKLLLLDEPTQGVDVQAKVEIMRIIDELTAEGVGIIIISDELSELQDICDRILVMYRGTIVREFTKGEAGLTHEALLRAIEGEFERDVA
jgi:ABC-type sugar transport system ATPase subunit